MTLNRFFRAARNLSSIAPVRRRTRRAVASLEQLEVRAMLSAASVTLLEDLAPRNAGSNISSIVPTEDRVYVINESDSDTDERQLFVTDGTDEGTRLIHQGTDDVRELTPFGNDLLYVTGNFNQPAILWRANGTTGEPETIGTFAGGLSGLAVFRDKVFFRGDDDVSGSELWTTDGTAGGTVQVADIEPGEDSSFPTELTVVGDELFFYLGGSRNNAKLYKTDGTSEGTVLVERLKGWRRSFGQAVVGQDLFFPATSSESGNELWKTDGTTGGTFQVAEISPGSGNASPSNLTNLGDQLIFTARDRVSGNELWTSDGTSDGTRLLKDVTPGLADSFLTNFRSVAGKVLFTRVSNSSLDEVWATDGTEDGTIRLGEFDGLDARWSAATAAHYYFTVSEAGEPSRLWRSDGTVEGTVMVPDVDSAGISQLTSNGTDVFYVASDTQTGAELWTSDGTTTGTEQVADLNTTGESSNPQGLYSIGEQKFLRANGRLYQVEEEGLQELAGTESVRLVEEADEFLLFGRLVNSDRQLWKTDGTEAGTEFLADIEPDFQPEPVVLNGRHYFRAVVGSLDSGDVYRTDGTVGGTEIAFNFRTNDQMFVIGDALFMIDSSRFLYRWQEGDERPEPFFEFDSNPEIFGMKQVGQQVFIEVGDSVSGLGSELWVTDGTTEGTRIVKDIAPGEADSSPTIVGSHLDNLFFTAITAEHGRELWITDGTEDGTRMIADIAPGPESSGPGMVTVLGSQYFFSANDGTHGRELWTTDGTLSGTQLVSDINQGPGDALGFGAPHLADGLLLLSADDGESGTELWVTDGTSAGTRQVTDINPGSDSSNPSVLGNSGTAVVISAFTDETGREPWIVTDLEAGDPPLPLDVRLSGTTLNYRGTPADEVISINLQADEIVVTAGEASARFPAAQVERIRFHTGAGNDFISVSAPIPADIRGGQGNDTIFGSSVDDTLFGGKGDDILEGRDGNDKLQGGTGNDTLDGGDGNDSLRGRGGRDELNGGDGDDTLKGGKLRDSLFGGSGNDLILGGTGRDILQGDAGRDILLGGVGRDQLFGGEGEDILIGGWSTLPVRRLRQVMAEWASSRSYDQRVANIQGDADDGESNNGNSHLATNPGTRTVYDSMADRISGGDDTDWFFANLTRSHDQLDDRLDDEVATDV